MILLRNYNIFLNYTSDPASQMSHLILNFKGSINFIFCEVCQMSYKEIFADIYKKHKYQILILLSVALIWSAFLFFGQIRTASADTVLNTPSALSLETFGSSSAELATSVMETVGVSADPYTVLTFIGIVSRLNEHFGWNLNISPGLMKYDVIFAMVAILFCISKISKCFGSTKALSMIHFSEIEKWVGLIFTVLLSSSVFIDLVTRNSTAMAGPALFACTAGMPGSASAASGAITGIAFMVLSFFITLLSWIIYYIVKLFFDFLDIITLPLSAFPGATFVYETVKTAGVISVMTAIMFFPVIGLVLCLLIIITAAVFFKKSYAAMLYFRKIYLKPFFRGIFGYSETIPLVHKKFPSRVEKLFPESEITLALPVYNIKALETPKIRRYTRLWLVCSNREMFLCLPSFKKKDGFVTFFSSLPKHPVYLKKSRRFLEIFCTPEGEDMNRKYARIRKNYHLVLSKEYSKRIDEILSVSGYSLYTPVKKHRKKKQ